MYFDAAEAKIVELESRLADLEEEGNVDPAPIMAAIDAIRATQAAQAAELERLDARLDAIASAAGD